jgi:hypothetical protein
MALGRPKGALILTDEATRLVGASVSPGTTSCSARADHSRVRSVHRI